MQFNLIFLLIAIFFSGTICATDINAPFTLSEFYTFDTDNYAGKTVNLMTTDNTICMITGFTVKTINSCTQACDLNIENNMWTVQIQQYSWCSPAYMSCNIMCMYTTGSITPPAPGSHFEVIANSAGSIPIIQFMLQIIVAFGAFVVPCYLVL
jgi:hypothetical protein